MDPLYLNGFLGGCLLGAGSLLAFAITRKVPGISGIFARTLRPKANEVGWRWVFLAGLTVGAVILFQSIDAAAVFRVPAGRNLAIFAAAGLIVGFGTRLGGGCTSGHGVCGIGMRARDSIVATLLFMAAGMVTVYLFKILAPVS